MLNTSFSVFYFQLSPADRSQPLQGCTWYEAPFFPGRYPGYWMVTPPVSGIT